mgnify:FL=1
MKYKLIYMDLVLDDMAAVKRYLSGFYPGTWPRFSQKLEDGISALSSMPYICEAYRSGSDYRCLVVEDYLVLYKVNETEKAVYIHRILHGSRDIQRFLNT